MKNIRHFLASSLSSRLLASSLTAALAASAPACTDEPDTLAADESALKSAAGQQADIVRADRPVADQYIVVLHKDRLAQAGESVATAAASMARGGGGRVLATYEHALSGFAVRMSEAAARALVRDPRVAYVAEDGVVGIDTTQTSATWGLDRTDERDRDLNGNYTYHATGANVHAYVIDTGIRLTHQELSGRVGAGYDAVTSGGAASDCNGHGTHVAGTIGGTTYGIAKSVTLHPVRVLDCGGSGYTSGVISRRTRTTAAASISSPPARASRRRTTRATRRPRR